MRRAWLVALWALGACATGGHGEMAARADALMQSAPERRGDLELHCDPMDAEVVLDGVPQGTCEDFDGRIRRLAVGEGMRRVEVKKQGFWPYETYYQPSGAKAVLRITLTPRDEAQGGAP